MYEMNSFVCFLGESLARQKRFEITWPLGSQFLKLIRQLSGICQLCQWRNCHYNFKIWDFFTSHYRSETIPAVKKTDDSWIKLQSFKIPAAKGHLISKANYQAVVSPKKQTKGVWLYYITTLQVKKSKLVCSFFWRIYGLTFCFWN